MTRRARMMKQADLARLAGVTQETISKAERGLLRLNPTLQTLIAAILGSTRAELFPAPDQHTPETQPQPAVS